EERALWEALTKDRRFASCGFKRQVPIGPHIVDIVSFPLRAAIDLVPGGESPEAGQGPGRQTAVAQARGHPGGGVAGRWGRSGRCGCARTDRAGVWDWQDGVARPSTSVAFFDDFEARRQCGYVMPQLVEVVVDGFDFARRDVFSGDIVDGSADHPAFLQQDV